MEFNHLESGGRGDIIFATVPLRIVFVERDRGIQPRESRVCVVGGQDLGADVAFKNSLLFNYYHSIIIIIAIILSLCSFKFPEHERRPIIHTAEDASKTLA